jgi:hypothetical protein
MIHGHSIFRIITPVAGIVVWTRAKPGEPMLLKLDG